MPIVSVTRLRLRSFRYLIPFLSYTLFSLLQAKKSAGNLYARIRKTQGLAFWTLSVWRDSKSLENFRNGPPHLYAMPKLKQWCDEAAFFHWEQNSEQIPSWSKAAEELQRHGRLSKVQHPSFEHEQGIISII